MAAAKPYRILIVDDHAIVREGLKQILAEVDDIVVAHLDGLPAVVRRLEVAVGVVAVPAHAAQGVVDLLVTAGLDAVLNFAPVHVRAPEHVAVRSVDLSTELQMLSFHRARGSLV